MIGFQVNQRQRCVEGAVVELYKKLPVANVSDMMARMFAAGPNLRPMHNGCVMAGPALTVRSRPGDNLLVHKALEMAQAGDVIVVDAGGDLTNAIIGEIMVAYAKKRHLAGIVINGAIRDSSEIRQGDFPVFATGVTHRGPYKDGPGEINVAISIGGMIVEPGDLVVGDADGVLCIPFDSVDEVYNETLRKHEVEEKMLAEIEAGTYDASWVDARLLALGCKL